MSDELDRLKAALQASPPAPDPAARDAALRAALEKFDDLQESAGDARQTEERQGFGARLSKGVSVMFDTLTSRAGLAATTGLVTAAVALFVILPQSPDLMAPKTSVTATKLPEAQPLPAPPPSAEGAGTSAPAEAERAEVDQAAPLAEPLVLADEAASMEAEAQNGFSVQGLRPQAEALSPAPAMSAQKSLRSAPVGEMVSAPADRISAPQPDTESYANADPNPVKLVTEEPVSTFSVDVDTASYAVVRSSLMRGQMPRPDAVRVEEMVNYFPYDYAAPEGDGAPFLPTVSVSPTPWNDGTQLVHIALQGELPAVDDRPPLNLVFLIDTSGSMQDANKLPLLKQSFRLMLSELRPEDEVSIVTYAGSAGQVLAPTRAGDRATILAALDRLEAGGSTAGQAGLQQAYAVAETMTQKGEVSRILLATDGDFNVGIHDPEALKTFIADKRDSGTYLSVLGFGRGNLDDATMQALAQNGNGQAAYIDTLNEARKVLVDQLSGALFPIANDVKIQVEFNPATVAEYRLIGYETRALKREDFNNDKIDAGEIGAGHQVTALYEVTPVGSAAVLNDPLRYGRSEPPQGPADELGFLRLRYKQPGEGTSRLIEAPIPVAPSAAGPEQRFAAAIAGFAQLLRGSAYLGDWGFDDAIALANGAKGDDAYGYRAEAVQLMRLAQSLSGN